MDFDEDYTACSRIAFKELPHGLRILKLNVLSSIIFYPWSLSLSLIILVPLWLMIISLVFSLISVN